MGGAFVFLGSKGICNSLAILYSGITNPAIVLLRENYVNREDSAVTATFGKQSPGGRGDCFVRKSVLLAMTVTLVAAGSRAMQFGVSPFQKSYASLTGFFYSGGKFRDSDQTTGITT